MHREANRRTSALRQGREVPLELSVGPGGRAVGIAALLPGLGHRVKGQAVPRKPAALCGLCHAYRLRREVHVLVHPAHNAFIPSRLSW